MKMTAVKFFLLMQNFVILFIFICFTGENASAQQMNFQLFDGTVPPVNKEGFGYPTYYDGGPGIGGPLTISIDSTDKVSGNSLKLVATQSNSELYAQFSPYDGVGREFARTYAGCGWPPSCGNPASWSFNTYNKFRFWIKAPPQAQPLYTDGTNNCNMGTYVKRVTNADYYSDEDGGSHYYHGFNIPNSGGWTQVIMNMHPDHQRGLTNVDPGYLPYPTSGDPPNTYNYWDALTRFYMQCNVNLSVPAVWHLDQMEFYKEPYQENERSVSSITGTYIASANRIIVTWERAPAEESVNVEIRYAFSNIHQLGWASATPAPSGTVVPPGGGFYIGMLYNTTALPLAGRSIVYIAIKPQNSSLFSQIAIPLSGSLPSPVADTMPPAPPTNLRVGP